MTDQTPGAHTATLLFVDDEPNITRALRRVLHHKPYRILTAQGGEEALRLMEENAVDLVVADARMPGMDGSTLLGKICDRWPTSIRILLTGYPELDTTIKAINDGRIYRYFSKPWRDDEVRTVIEQSLAYQHAERERLRLQRLAQEQNEVLRELNQNLERRVQERTAELVATAELLKRVNNDLERSYVTATEVFASLINQRLPRSRQTNHDVIALIRAFCSAHSVPEKDGRNLQMAAALYNIGKLTWRDEMIALPLDRLGKEQRARFREYPGIGETLLMALEPAQEAAKLIRHHQERWDGGGYPDGLRGETIPWGARLIKLAVDTVEMQMGMIQERPLTREAALQAITSSAGRSYDPALCDAFVNVVENLPADGADDDDSILTLGSHALEPGMILARKLYSASGTLLLSEGKALNRRLIERLQEFERDEEVSYKLYVKRPELDSDE